MQRDSSIVELTGAPAFNFGQKVRSRKMVRNDGTFPGKEIGDILVKKGDIGFVAGIGTYLQQFYIYAVDFYEHGYRVGMKAHELEPLQEEDVEAAAAAPGAADPGRGIEASHA